MKEQWRPVHGFKGYEVSDRGRVRGPGGIKSQHACRGYSRVCLYRRRRGYFRSVHLLVARAFLGKTPRGKLVHHKDHDKKNSKLSNLEFATPKRNTLEAVRAGRFRRRKGSEHKSAKLRETDIVPIFEAVASGESRRSVSRRYKIGRTVVDCIVRREVWRHVVVSGTLVRKAQRTAHFNRGDQNGNAKLLDLAVVDVFRRAKAGEPLDTIAARYGVSRPLVSMVLHRKIRSHVVVPKSLLPRIKESGRLVWDDKTAKSLPKRKTWQRRRRYGRTPR